MKPLVGLSLMPEPEFLKASLPLFIDSEVDCVEWSFDTFRSEKKIPDWLRQLLNEFSGSGRLIGHGVRYSVFDPLFGKRQEIWLKQLRKETGRRRYNYITEHFGFMSSSHFHEGTPLPLPLNKTTLNIGIDRLKRLQDAAQLPVGLENLAFAFGAEDIKRQGEFLEKLIAPVNGFIILDLHNLYCQSENFDIDLTALVDLYPLQKVKEIHVSGGSWENTAYAKDRKKVRRDTHDEKVPASIFRHLPAVLEKCKKAEYIIFERLGHSLASDEESRNFRKDFLKLKKIALSAPGREIKEGRFKKPLAPGRKPLQSAKLSNEQQIILRTLGKEKDPFAAIEKLKKSGLEGWHIDSWKPYMVETAMQLLRKWG